METEKKRCDCGVLAGLVQGSYWLGLGVWLGGLVMLAVAAAITFKTSRAAGPVLLQPEYNTPELNGQAANILAGLIVGNVIQGLMVLQFICAGVVLVTMAIQHKTMMPMLKRRPKLNLARMVLLFVPMLALAASVGYIGPRMWQERQTMYNPELTVEARKEARVRFDGLHKLSERSVGAGAFCLLAAGLVSGVLFSVKTGRESGAE